MGAISIITKGIIYKSNASTNLIRYTIPLNLKLKIDKFKLNLKNKNIIKLNLKKI